MVIARHQLWMYVAVVFTSSCRLPSATKVVNKCRIFFEDVKYTVLWLLYVYELLQFMHK
jgi:hypothetical protein